MRMEPMLFPLVVPLLVGGFMILILLAARADARKASENLSALAVALGLQVIARPPVLGIFPQAPEVQGLRRGKRVRLFVFHTGSGKSRKPWCAVGVTPQVASPLRLSLEVQGFGARFLEFFGVKEITLGDRAFDEAWFVRGEPEDFVKAALIPEVRERFMDARRRGLTGTFRTEQGEVRYAEQGGFSDRRRVERFILAAELCCDLADVAEVAAG
jgi:hypothetical protein